MICIWLCVRVAVLSLPVSGVQWVRKHDRDVLNVSHPQSLQQRTRIKQEAVEEEKKILVQVLIIHKRCIYFTILCI